MPLVRKILIIGTLALVTSSCSGTAAPPPDRYTFPSLVADLNAAGMHMAPDTVATKQGVYDAMCRSNPQSLKDVFAIGVATQHADRDAVNRAVDRYCASVNAQ